MAIEMLARLWVATVSVAATAAFKVGRIIV
jgi:hypothetical protein